jgi:hypothetical protein
MRGIEDINLYTHFLKKQNMIVCLLLLALCSGCGKKKVVKKKPVLFENATVEKTLEEQVDERSKENNKVVFKNVDVKIKNWDDDNKDKLKVEYSSDNVIVIKGEHPVEYQEENKHNKRYSRKAPEIIETPGNSKAQKLLNRIKKSYIRWTPQWNFIGKGGVRLPSYALSRDKSLLCIVETIGRKEGPFGTRFIFINTYNWHVVHLITDLKHYVTKVRFVPKSNLLLCWAKQQKEMHQPYLLYTMRLHNGSIVEKSSPFKKDLSDILVSPSGKRVVVKLNDSPLLLSLPTNNLQKNMITYKSKNSSGRLMFISRRRHLILAGDTTYEILTHNLRLLNTLHYPTEFHPTSLSYSSDTDEIFLSQQYKKTYVLTQHTFQKLTDTLSGKWLYYNETEKTLYVSLAKLGEVARYVGENRKKIKSFYLSKMRPKTKGEVDLFTYLKHRNSFLCIDSDGNIYTVYKTKKKWKKFLIIAPKK